MVKLYESASYRDTWGIFAVRNRNSYWENSSYDELIEHINKRLADGADINCMGDDSSEATLLFNAIKVGRTDVAKWLVEKGADVNTGYDYYTETPLGESIYTGNIEMVDFLIAHGVDPNKPARGYKNPHDVQKPLELAAYSDNYKIIMHKLIKAGANVKDCDVVGQIALKGDKETAKKLIEIGAEKRDGWIERAAKQNNLAGLEMLVELGWDINKPDSHGNKPFINALTFFGTTAETIEKMVELGADINAKNERGQNALMCVLKGKNAQKIEKLIQLGIDVHTKDQEGKTALDIAMEEKDKIAIKLLKNASKIREDYLKHQNGHLSIEKDTKSESTFFTTLAKYGLNLTGHIIRCGAKAAGKVVDFANDMANHFIDNSR